MYSDGQLTVQRLAECPHCGCNDVDILRQPDQARWMGKLGMARCRHCGLRFTITQLQQPPAATSPPVTHKEPQINGTRQTAPQDPLDGSRCPECGGKSRVTSTRKLFRWRQCKECGHAFKVARSD